MDIDQILIKSLVQNGGLTDEDIAAIAGVPIAALAGWKSGHAKPPRHALILADLGHVTEHLAAYYTPDEIRHWLHAPHPQLDGTRPVDLIRHGRSIAVSAVIDRLDGDVFI
ncbi:antitoxin Xre/MbcA/ParS toxin-binding domain-containing protein [Saliniramus fredricksonii]|uniref:antitoxin Xre/MbcA/ParS toxin-binding domain-containing protein n=1 Tax=Saliniramus fredricksonii TaxID=1653334 RepID=UPI000944AA84|nr:antitoxin Xre/MbcA/ParS toxin-binding domain-containing protein [Saliniramus fredricksonii]